MRSRPALVFKQIVLLITKAPQHKLVRVYIHDAACAFRSGFHHSLQCDMVDSRLPDVSPFMVMAGQAVYRWATTKLTDALFQAMGRAGVGPEDIDVFAPHQANLRIVESMAKKLGLPERTVIARDIVQSGNTSAASIPLALTELLETGEAKSGDLALVLGYGAGLTFAGQVLRLP